MTPYTRHGMTELIIRGRKFEFLYNKINLARFQYRLAIWPTCLYLKLAVCGS